MGVGYGNVFKKIVTNDLVFCVDAGNSGSYPGSGTTWRDLSGLGNNGTLTNGPTFSSVNGGSIVFDGINDSIGFSNAPTFFSNYTIEAVFNVNGYRANEGHNIISWGAELQYQRRAMSLWNGGTSGTANFTVRSSTAFSNPGGSTVIQLNTWYAASVTLGSDGSVNIYLNGSLNGSGTNLLTNPSSNDFVIANNSSNEPFNGRISTVKIYNRVLTAAEIRQNFNALRGRYGI